MGIAGWHSVQEIYCATAFLHLYIHIQSESATGLRITTMNSNLADGRTCDRALHNSPDYQKGNLNPTLCVGEYTEELMV